MVATKKTLQQQIEEAEAKLKLLKSDGTGNREEEEEVELTENRWEPGVLAAYSFQTAGLRLGHKSR